MMVWKSYLMKFWGFLVVMEIPTESSSGLKPTSLALIDDEEAARRQKETEGSGRQEGTE